MGRQGLTLDIQGMSCGHCVAAVKKALSAVPGVLEVEVSLDPPRAKVAYDPSKATVKALSAAVEAEGFSCTPAAGL